MTLTMFTATAATCDVAPGTTEATDDGMLHIKRQVFTDLVESQDPRIAGTNRPTLDINLNPESGDGELRGSFTLQPTAVDGTWEGELQGQFIQGFVTSSGIARGTGALAGAVMRVEFQQVASYSGQLPCESPQAFFEMHGMILE